MRKKNKNKKGFTLIELLAVIVILAVILVISIPRILDVIETSKKDSFKTSAQLIADSAEKKYVENKLNNIDEEITCENVSKLSKEDYESCKITFDNEGNAKVTIEGKGKFKDLAICNGTKTSVELSDTCSTDAKYFAYEDVEDITVSDENKCKTYLISKSGGDITEEIATTLCNGGSVSGINLQIAILEGEIPSTDYEEAGLNVKDVYKLYENVTVVDQTKCVSYVMNLWNDTSDEVKQDATKLCNGGVVGSETLVNDVKSSYIPSLSYDLAGLTVTSKVYDKGTIIITGYNIEGGLDVVIPSEIDGKKVTAIGASAFESKGITSVIIPNTITSIGEGAFRYNKLTSVIIPSSVTSIGYSAFYISNSKIINNTNIADVDIWKRITGGACGPSIKMENNIIYLGKLKNC